MTGNVAINNAIANTQSQISHKDIFIINGGIILIMLVSFHAAKMHLKGRFDAQERNCQRGDVEHEEKRKINNRLARQRGS